MVDEDIKNLLYKLDMLDVFLLYWKEFKNKPHKWISKEFLKDELGIERDAKTLRNRMSLLREKVPEFHFTNQWARTKVEDVLNDIIERDYDGKIINIYKRGWPPRPPQEKTPFYKDKPPVEPPFRPPVFTPRPSAPRIKPDPVPPDVEPWDLYRRRNEEPLEELEPPRSRFPNVEFPDLSNVGCGQIILWLFVLWFVLSVCNMCMRM